MTDDPPDITVSKIAVLLDELGVQHTVGMTWNKAGAPVVVVDLPSTANKSLVEHSLSDHGLNAEVRRVTRSIIAH